MQEYDRGGWRKIERQTNKHEQSLGLTKSRRRLCNTTCMCGLTLAWVTSENSTKATGVQTSWVDLLRRGRTLSSLLLSPESGVDCPCPWFHANSSAASPLSWCNCYRRRNWTRRHEFKSWTMLIAFHIALIPLGKVWIQIFSLQLWVNSRTDWVLQPWWGN